MNQRRDLLQESLAAIERLEARLAASEAARHEPIAIIGAGCRYPGGVDTPEGLWQLLREGTDAVSEVPADRWDSSEYYDPDPKAPGKMITKWGGFLSGIDKFDARFFGISPREAATMDPQQRLLLETAYEALESAGVAPDRLAGSATGVFVGITTTDYGQRMFFGNVGHNDVYSATGGALNVAAGRLAFNFGFQGPCVAVDTACSSSLVAVHMACKSLRAGECELALAGGVNIILSPDLMVLFSKWGMMAADGRCKTFDASANGFVRSEGCAVIALKRLSKALADKDPVLAVIRGSAINSDGRSSGLTVPNGPAQEAVIRTALADARLAPADIDYVEAHGTGTPLGDPIEVEALGAVLAGGRSADRPLLVGAVKSNLGHTEAAAGLAGLLKVLLSLRHEAIPPDLHFKTPNPAIPWASLPVAIPTRLAPWPRGPRVRRAGISSFGFSGTNAHVILEEAPAAATDDSRSDRGPFLVPLSARTDAGLRDTAQRLLLRLSEPNVPRLEDIAYTLATGRAHHARRVVLVAESVDALKEQVRSVASGEMPVLSGTVPVGQRSRVAFLFTGQGSQYAGMGRALYESEPVFREWIDKAATILQPSLPRPLTEILFPADAADNTISSTACTQPALFALEYALAELWRSWGITPSIVVGHSVGEYVAACVAGVFSFEDGLALVAERGRLMQALPAGGGMAAVFASAAKVRELLVPFAGSLSVAAVNGPEEVVVSGDSQALARLLDDVTRRGVKSKALEVSHAFHSHLLEPMLDQFERAAAGIRHRPPRIALISNLTGTVFAAGTGPDARYWRRHARESVQFAACIDALQRADATVLVEVGPHPTLLSLVARALPDTRWACAVSLRRGRDDRLEMLTSAAILHAHGAALKWDALLGACGGRRIELPTYPFQRERYWVEPTPARRTRRGTHALLGERQESPRAGAQFLSELSAAEPAFLADHVILDRVLLPATGYVEMALAAARVLMGGGPLLVRDFAIEAPLKLESDATHLVHTEIDVAATGQLDVTIRSRPAAEGSDAQWRTHARGVLEKASLPLAAATKLVPEVRQARTACGTSLDIADYYERLQRFRVRYGPTFRGVRALQVGAGIATGLLEVEGTASSDSQWNLHPALLDSAIHLIGAVMFSEPKGSERVFAPVGIDKVLVVRRAPARAWASARLRDAQPGSPLRIADLRLEDDSGNLIALVTGLKLREVNAESLARALDADSSGAHTYGVSWKPAPVGDGASLNCRVALISDGAGFGKDLAQVLQRAGAAVSVIPAEGIATFLDATHTVRPWIVDCSALDLTGKDDARAGYLLALRAVQSLAASSKTAGFCVVTRGAQAISASDELQLGQAPLVGLVRTLAAERTDLRVLRVDLDPGVPADARGVLRALASEAAIGLEVGVRNGQFLVPVLQEQAAQGRPAARAQRDREVLRILERGALENITVKLEPRRAPGAGEVEIRVRAAALNFRDVLNVLGMYPGDAGNPGFECSGVVTAVGAGVEHVRLGDEVVAIAADSMASHVTCSATLVVRKPSTLTFADAATIPNVYLTAAQCLSVVANLQPGQRILVHAAAGGVGLAAVRLARRAGAEVIATAGSPAKRAFVLAEGAAHALDSRSLSFADEVMRVTGGAGVDVVLNSLAGDFIPASMRVLKKGGLFVEIGKSGIWTEEQVRREAPAIRYTVVDLGEAIQRDVTSVRKRFEDLMNDVAAGALAPLPVRTFPLREAVAAFRYMATARHIGKVVLIPDADADERLTIRKDGTYLITGALGGLGLAAIQWLAASGAGEILALARRPASATEREAIEAARARGTKIELIHCDVSDAASLRALWQQTITARPLRGVLHMAGSLADAPIGQQDAQRFDAVAGPKISGAWTLHELIGRRPLDFFVLFSSASVLFGSPAQANYTAANSFLDGLAAHRCAHGLPALSVGWGAWAEVGMAARLSAAGRARFERGGVGFLAPAAAFSALERTAATASSYAAIAVLRPAQIVAEAPHLASLFSELVTTRTPAAAEAADAQESADTLRRRIQAAPPNRRKLVLRDHVRQMTVRVLGIQRPEDLDVNEPLRQFGLDSLMAVELRNLLSKTAGQTLSATLTFDHPSVTALVDHLAELAFAREIGIAARTPVVAVVEPTLADRTAVSAEELDRLSGDELAAALESRLERMSLEDGK
jgi:acyl transferase domain-containing protein/acyl carrier protein